VTQETLPDQPSPPLVMFPNREPCPRSSGVRGPANNLRDADVDVPGADGRGGLILRE